MFSLEIEVEGDRDLLIANLYELGACGISEPDGHAIRAFFEDPADRATLFARFPGSKARSEEDRDWVQHARDLLQPAAVGQRFFLVPEWRDDPAPEGRFRITVNPGMAFGTGVHETTQLCIEALEDLVRPGVTVLDVGTGSGILRKTAGLLGARATYACDIDPDAVAIAGDAFIGSVDAVRSSSVDLVVANISPEAIVALANDLVRVLRPGGALIASGFEKHEVEMVRAALPAGAELRTKGNWAALICRAADGTRKAEIRAAAIRRRDALAPEVRREHSAAAVGRIIEMPEFRDAACVMAYASFRSEIDTTLLLEATLAAGKHLILPRVNGDSLVLYRVTDLSACLEPGAWGIREPRRDACVACALDELDFILLPGAAFDRQGGRIGYGRGFFDKLLAGLPTDVKRPRLVAAAFEVQIVEHAPAEPHDVRFDALITEAGEWRVAH